MPAEQKNMYIGNRYIPKVFGEWDQTQPYEGLSIVTYQGASYTSNMNVPVGIPITNKIYWTLSGNYNAQIEYYRSDVERVKENIETLKTETETKLIKTSRQIDDMTISVKDFGAVGDSDQTAWTDNTNAIRQAILEASKVDGSTIFFPKSNGYGVTDTISFPSNIHIKMDSPIVLMNAQEIVGLVVGDGSYIRTMKHELRFVRKVKSNWVTEQNIGIQVINSDSSDFHILQVENNTIGFQAIGDARAFSYNNVYFHRLIDNKIHVDLTNVNKGWNNENSFYNGRFANISTTHKYKSRYGVRITTKDGQYINNNNNVFIKPSFELQAPDNGEALPILIEHGSYNRFENVRNEFNTGTLLKTLNDSNNNFVSAGYGRASVDNQSTRKGNVAVDNRRVLADRTKPIFSSGKLVNRISPFTDIRTSIHGFHIRDRNTAVPLNFHLDAQFRAERDSLRLINGYGIGVYADTEKNKTFDVQWNGDPDIRLAVVPYDSAGNIITADNMVTSGDFASLSKNGLFGGCYQMGVRDLNEMAFTVHADVKKIEIILHAWNVATVDSPHAYLKNFIIKAETVTAIWNHFEPEQRKGLLARDKPVRTTPATVKGTTLYNAEITELGSTGSKYFIEGWTCLQVDPPVWSENRVLTGN